MAYDDTATTVINLLTAEFSSDFKAIFDGDPIWIPTSMLPAIAVVKTREHIEAGATGIDELYQTISIRIILNLNEYFGASMDVETAHKKLKDYVELRIDTGEYDNHSIMGVVRKQFTLGNTIVNQTIDTEYDILTEGRSLQGKDGVITEEAHITFTTRQLVPVPVRS